MIDSKVSIDHLKLVEMIIKGEVTPSFANKVNRATGKYTRGQISKTDYEEEIKKLYLEWEIKRLKKRLRRI